MYVHSLRMKQAPIASGSLVAPLNIGGLAGCQWATGLRRGAADSFIDKIAVKGFSQAGEGVEIIWQFAEKK